MSTTSITERITVTINPDTGSITVRARAPHPVLDSQLVFDGFCSRNYRGADRVFVWATAYIGEPAPETKLAMAIDGVCHQIPAVELSDETEGQSYLIALATLALAANGVTA